MIRVLRGRWFYVILVAVVLTVYGRMVLSGSARPPAQTFQSLERQTSVPHEVAELDVDAATLLEASAKNPPLALFLAFWLMLGLGLGCAGVVLGVRALWKKSFSQLLRYPSKLPSRWSFGEWGRIMLLLMLVASLLPFVRISLMIWGVPWLSNQHFTMVIFMVILEVLFMLIVWGFASTKTLSLASAFGFSSRGTFTAIRTGLVGYAAIFPWVFGLLWLIATVCQHLGLQPPMEPIHELLFMDDKVTVGLTILLACVLGPIAEEMFFRGILYSALRRRRTRLVAMLLSGGLFAAVHTNAVGFVPIVILGCLLADLYERTGSLVAPIAVHILHNTLLVAVGLSLKQLVWPG